VIGVNFYGATQSRVLFHIAKNQIVFLESTSPIRCFEKENAQIDPSAGKKLPHHMTSASGCSSSIV